MLYLLLALFTAAIVAVDQLTKYLAAANLVGKTVTLIPGWLQLHYITNDGMALSLLRGARWLFVVMTAVYLAVVIYVLVKKWFKKDAGAVVHRGHHRRRDRQFHRPHFHRSCH